jgi:hypothetical protein
MPVRPRLFPVVIGAAGIGVAQLFWIGPSTSAERAEPLPPTANIKRLTGRELDALMARLNKYWIPQPRLRSQEAIEEVVVRIRIQLKPDGTLASPPMVMTRGTSETHLAARESAVRAIVRSQPFDMLSAANYEAWKEMEIAFDTRDWERR